ncbi:phage portal protein [Pseudoramibacter alactolyticus]|uniref:phage portal protein n=1 Tax=Pseudoramibacter alactolyticus TaxID=113287 RepID=UPI00235410EF|nr:phage portal protein [Pseudoramibacter alactolyticus]MBM6968672.1 phage portal protein [Pseudoramibacter alactolyticus]
MGLFDKIFGKKPKNQPMDQGIFETLTGYAPIFRNREGSLYESELVRAAIDARARHISKLRVTMTGTAQRKLQTRLTIAPNSWQTWGQFLYRLSTILDMQNTAFTVPVIGEMDFTTGFFPVLPTNCEIRDVDGQPFLRYRFNNGDMAAVELERCGVMTRFQYSDDFFGETNEALDQTMDLIDIQNQGIGEAVKESARYRFMAKLNNFSKPEDLEKERKRFTRKNLQGEEGGVLLWPNTYTDIQQIKPTPYTVDKDQMAMIQTNVYNYFGVNEDILQNKAYGDAWAAFYEGCVEHFAIQFSDVMTKTIFTQREITNGNSIMATANRLQYLSNADKLNVSSQMSDRGIMNRDEIREIWNLPPLPNGQGQAYTIRGEYSLVNADGTSVNPNQGDSMK